MRTRKALIAPALISVMALSLAGCAKPPSETGNPGSAGQSGSGSGGYKACMVSDSGGFDDKSFNQTSHKGLEDAAKKLGIETGEIESTGTADFAKNVQEMVDTKCNMIITVGFLLSDATVAAAKANPEIDFAIVDDNPEGAADLKNLKPLVFNTAQSSFMAGYVAAATTKTNKVGTFGGMNIPTVTIFMDGFAQGVKYHNEKKGTDVQVLGWDADKQDGQFVPGENAFENIAGGKQTATNLITQGADIIMPVAGPAGEGGLQAVQASGGKANAIWVDTDGCESAASYCNSLITSVYKGMDLAVEDAIKSSHEDKFDNTPYVGTLENKGTGLSPYHSFDSKIPADVKTEVEQLAKDIESGSIKIESKSQPKN